MSKNIRESLTGLGIVIACALSFSFLTALVLQPQASPVEQWRKVASTCKYVQITSSGANVSLWPDPAQATRQVLVTNIILSNPSATVANLTLETLAGSPVTITRLLAAANTTLNITLESPLPIARGEGIQVDNAAAQAIDVTICGWEEGG